MNSGTLDRLGISVSIVCGIHCVATPLLFGAAAFPLGWALAEKSEAVLLAAALLIGVTSLLPGYLRQHRQKRCLALFFAGAAGLAVAKLGLESAYWEPWLVSGAAAFLAAAHLSNLRLCRSCNACSGHGHRGFDAK